jgi:hypothetical protein
MINAWWSVLITALAARSEAVTHGFFLQRDWQARLVPTDLLVSRGKQRQDTVITAS